MERDALTKAAALLIAGVAGGVVAVAAASLVGLGEGTTTVREVTPPLLTPANDVSSKSGGSLTLREIYKRYAPGVVQVTSTTKVQLPQNDFFPNPFIPGTEVQRALGSGFVIDKAGYIVTNYHVVRQAQSVDVSFSNSETMKAKIVGTDPFTDIALLKVEASSRALRPLNLGNSDTAQVGDSVAAIGNPFGYDRSITQGIVSALQRSLTAPSGSPIDHVIQTDARLNQGNSGGPLLNAKGEVIGVNSAIATGDSGDNVGIGFAIPINTVRSVVAELKTSGHVDHPYLGVVGHSVDPSFAKGFDLAADRGVLVERVIPGSGAEQAGLRGGSTPLVVDGESYVLGGDLIVKAAGSDVNSTERLREIVADHRPGDTIRVEYFRDDGTRGSVDVKLGQPPTPQE